VSLLYSPRFLTERIPVGFWRGNSPERHAAGCPNPGPSRVDLKAGLHERVVTYLRNGSTVSATARHEDSTCFLCGLSLPEKAASQGRWVKAAGPLTYLEDGAFVWPAGLAHYVEKHNVDLPQVFLERCLRGGGRTGWVAAPRGQATRVTALDDRPHWQAHSWASCPDHLREHCILALEMADLDVTEDFDAVLVEQGATGEPLIELGLRFPLLAAGPRPAPWNHAGEPMTWKRVCDKATIDVVTLGLK
jgi:hypothetical protein